MMASQILEGATLGGKLEEYILQKTDGVPFFIEELIRSLKDSKTMQKRP
jgi:predicted ATPase